MTRNRHLKTSLLKALLAGACGTGCAAAASPVLAQDAAEAASAQRAADAAKSVADAALAAASAAVAASAPAPAPAAEILHAPPAPTPAPQLILAAAAAESSFDAGADLLGGTGAMPVANARLLAKLSADRAAPAAPAAPIQAPLFAPAMMPTAPADILPGSPAPAPALAPAPAPILPAIPEPAPLAAPTLLATLGAAPVSLPTAAALEAAVAAQTTPVLPPAPVYRAAPAPAPRVQYAAAAARPRRRAAIEAGNARFMRAVVSTAAVSIEMPDVGRQISPFGLLLGQLVTSQETPGSQYGLAEEMAMPARPRMVAMPEVAVPLGFCSAEQRGAFMEGIYQPAMAIARHNSEVAAAYVRKLRTLYDNYQLSGDTRAQGAIAAEAKDFARTANAAGSIHDELANQFEDIMTTPVSTCGTSQ